MKETQKLYRLKNRIVVTPGSNDIAGSYIIVKGIRDKDYSVYTKGRELVLRTHGKTNPLLHTGGVHGSGCDVIAEIKRRRVTKK